MGPAMHSIFSYLLAGGIGVLIAFFMSRPPELQSLRLSQLILVPAVMVACVYFMPDPRQSSAIAGVGSFICFLGALGFLVLLLAPNLGHFCGVGLSSFLDPQDWTS